ncbi:VIP peptides isoform X1 [Dermochelys coriacea]|uniref:VIP peptides isoform X1 n=2 Tax=Dermochelys coriacea TaxID=27794 RepID=UPI001CA8066D|nr:VIP peptides isoform X1 [Dermochelys coriacea]
MAAKLLGSSRMEHRSSSQLLLSFTLFSVLCSPALALPPLGTYSAMSRLGNRMPFDGASESDQAQGSLKPETDILQNALPENDKFYFDMSRAIDRNARHADGLFTSGYSKLLGQLSARRYLESLIGKRVSNNLMDEQMPVKRHSDAVFTDNYSRFRKQMAVKKYLNSVLTGKRSQEELNPTSLRHEAELLEPSFSETYDDVTVDELLNRLPLNL